MTVPPLLPPGQCPALSWSVWVGGYLLDSARAQGLGWSFLIREFKEDLKPEGPGCSVQDPPGYSGLRLSESTASWGLRKKGPRSRGSAEAKEVWVAGSGGPCHCEVCVCVTPPSGILVSLRSSGSRQAWHPPHPPGAVGWEPLPAYPAVSKPTKHAQTTQRPRTPTPR